MNGHSDADVSGHCVGVKAYGRCNSVARGKAWVEGYSAQPHRWRIDQSIRGGPHNAGAQSSVGVAKERVGDIMMAARAKTGQ